MALTAPQKLKQYLVHAVTGVRHDTPDAIQAEWERLAESDDCEIGDIESEVRPGKEETGLTCESSRHYESKAVAAQMLDGSYVGWTYWYGGGKHGEPEAIDWIDDAYDVVMTEVMRPVKEFVRA